MDVLCQAKSGMGKTAVFVLATLQQIEPRPNEVAVVVLCHTRELAFQIKNEYGRFSKYMPDVKTAGMQMMNSVGIYLDQSSTVEPASSRTMKRSRMTAPTLWSAPPDVFWP